MKDRCPTPGPLLRHRAKLPLHVLKAAEGQHAVLVLNTGIPRCCDPSRALASLKPNLVAMLTNPGYDLAITSPAESPALHLVQLPNGRVFFKATPPVNVVSVNTAV